MTSQKTSSLKGLEVGKLAEKMNTASVPQFGLPCGVTRVMKKMDEEDRKAFELVLFPAEGSLKKLSIRQIYEILMSENHDIAQSSLALHRRKQCRCFTGIAARIETLGG